MNSKPITLVISDLHIGGGPADKGDDHIYQKQELVRFLRQQAATPAGQQGDIELFINGDFLEFAQANQAAFLHYSDDFWCSEAESLQKLETIIAGHGDIFAELSAFQTAGNVVTLAAGNHDVDLYWPRVQARLRQVAGAKLQFELGIEWCERYEGKLQIGHGHMSDPANSFQYWSDPVRITNFGTSRLEMCPGTLFMVKFVNKLEDRYPFADNLLPVTKLAAVLLREDKWGLASVGWMFAKFCVTSPAALDAKVSQDYGERLLARFRDDAQYAERLAAALARQTPQGATPSYSPGSLTQARLAELMFSLLGRIDDTEWEALFGLPPAATMGADEVTLMAIAQANFEDGKEKLRVVAQNRIDATAAAVVVMGHTHQPHEVHFKDGGHYYNPGCWTRYLELKAGQKVTLDDLRDEDRYPYQLNFVRIESNDKGELSSKMDCFESGQ